MPPLFIIVVKDLQICMEIYYSSKYVLVQENRSMMMMKMNKYIFYFLQLSFFVVIILFLHDFLFYEHYCQSSDY